jgi:hypothetical protein
MHTSQQISNESDQLISRRALALRWGVSVETIKRRQRDGILRAIRFNERLLRYKLRDVVAIEASAGGAKWTAEI